MEVFVIKSPSGSLVPASQADADVLAGLPKGRVFKSKITQPRNLPFHRKGFALFQTVFDLWSERLEAREFQGREVRPELNRFRKDMTIMAGFFRPVFNARGEVRVEAESLSFASMTDDRFAKVYSALIDTALEKILKDIDRADLEDAVERVMRFA